MRPERLLRGHVPEVRFWKQSRPRTARPWMGHNVLLPVQQTARLRRHPIGHLSCRLPIARLQEPVRTGLTAFASALLNRVTPAQASHTRDGYLAGSPGPVGYGVALFLRRYVVWCARSRCHGQRSTPAVSWLIWRGVDIPDVSGAAYVSDAPLALSDESGQSLLQQPTRGQRIA